MPSWCGRHCEIERCTFVQSPSLKKGDEEFLKKITDLRDYCMESAYNEVLHLSSESLVVSHQVHGNNISRRIQKKRISNLTTILDITSCNRLQRRRKFLKQDSMFITAVQDAAPSVGFVVTEALHCISWLVREVVQIYHYRWFGLIDCEIGVSSE